MLPHETLFWTNHSKSLRACQHILFFFLATLTTLFITDLYLWLVCQVSRSLKLLLEVAPGNLHFETKGITDTETA